MAKSLRSKWKRKMRATKRNKNEPRVLKQLKETLTKDQVIMTEDMVKFQQLDNALKAKGEEEKQQRTDAAVADDGSMEVESKRDKRTLLDPNGQYPSWVNGRMAKKLRAKRKPSKKKGGVQKSTKGKLLAW